MVGFHKGGQRRVDESFGFGVQSGGGFVEDQDVRVFDEGAGDSDALLLAARELGAAGADIGVDAFGLE